ncbi:hypothetical protein T265_04322 [Opisthorchis viverrini]|uniref:Uncharacterized protein n=1 Tax=Opisthorchis viverrini TaxID=6198 RepID=A0A075A049_OPIVI|nr:hypothetical protein T265_04322 [Opisthorchis viverrini]KER28940.1 hypothetical protein T265_04322 [Opisthorchis viverrini]
MSIFMEAAMLPSPEEGRWLEREFTDRKVRGSNPTSASRLPLSRFGQPGSIPALVLPLGGMAARHRKSASAGRFFHIFLLRLSSLSLEAATAI